MSDEWSLEEFCYEKFCCAYAIFPTFAEMVREHMFSGEYGAAGDDAMVDQEEEELMNAFEQLYEFDKVAMFNSPRIALSRYLRSKVLGITLKQYK